MINELILMGLVIVQPELKYWEKGNKVVPVAKFQIDTKKDTLEVCVFGDTAEWVSSEITTGDSVLVKGRVKGKIDEKKKIVEIYGRAIEKIDMGGGD